MFYKFDQDNMRLSNGDKVIERGDSQILYRVRSFCTSLESVTVEVVGQPALTKIFLLEEIELVYPVTA